MNPTSRLIEIDRDRSLFFEERGDGPPLVLIHGALATHRDWRPDLCIALASHHRVIALDRPGHGRSARPRYAGAPRRQAVQIRRGLQLGHRAILVGHSFGAVVALAYAELFPDEVEALVLISPLGLPEFRPLEHLYLAPRATPIVGPLLSSWINATYDPHFFEAAQRLMFAPLPVSPAWRARIEQQRILSPNALVAEGEDAAAIAPAAPSAHLALTEITHPSRIILGDGDAIVRHERQGLPLALLMRASVTRLAGVGHMAQEARPEIVVDAVATLRSKRAEGRASETAA